MAAYSISRRRAIALLLLTSILLITLDVNGNPMAERARSVFSYALRPFETAALVVWRPLQRAWNGVANYDELQDEVDALRAEVEAMRGTDVAARADILEYQELVELNRIPGISTIPTITAQVVGAAPSNFQLTVEIDKGSESCIATGMPVVGPGGLIGKVTEAHRGRAVVMLITDPRYAVGVKLLAAQGDGAAATTTTSTPVVTTPSGIPVEDLNSTTTSSTTSTSTSTTTTTPQRPTTTSTTSTLPGGSTVPGATSTSTTAPVEVLRETGLLKGRGPDELPQVVLVQSEIKVGDSVVTSGGEDELAPDGIPVGTVTRVISRTSSSGPILEVQHSADIDHLNFVRVLLYRPASENVTC